MLMLRCGMRTTISIDDGLYRRTKARAAESGQSVGSVIEDALRALLDRPETSGPLAPLTVFDGTGVLPGIDLDDNASVRAALDEGRDPDAVR